MSQNKHVYGGAYLGSVKRSSALDATVARSEKYITYGDKVSFRGNFGTVKMLGDNKGDKIYSFAFLTFWCETFISIYCFYCYSNH